MKTKILLLPCGKYMPEDVDNFNGNTYDIHSLEALDNDIKDMDLSEFTEQINDNSFSDYYYIAHVNFIEDEDNVTNESGLTPSQLLDLVNDMYKCISGLQNHLELREDFIVEDHENGEENAYSQALLLIDKVNKIAQAKATKQ